MISNIFELCSYSNLINFNSCQQSKLILFQNVDKTTKPYITDQ